MNTSTERMYYVLFFLYSSVALTYRVWIPSFATMLEITSKERAALLGAIYGGFLTCFRYVFIYWDPDTAKSLKGVSLISMIILLVSLIMY